MNKKWLLFLLVICAVIVQVMCCKKKAKTQERPPGCNTLNCVCCKSMKGKCVKTCPPPRYPKKHGCAHGTDSNTSGPKASVAKTSPKSSTTHKADPKNSNPKETAIVNSDPKMSKKVSPKESTVNKAEPRAVATKVQQQPGPVIEPKP